jgi:hypothetical protein
LASPIRARLTLDQQVYFLVDGAIGGHWKRDEA